MKDNTTTALIIGLILGIIIGAFAGYHYSERHHQDSFRINIGGK